MMKNGRTGDRGRPKINALFANDIVFKNTIYILVSRKYGCNWIEYGQILLKPYLFIFKSNSNTDSFIYKYEYSRIQIRKTVCYGISRTRMLS